MFGIKTMKNKKFNFLIVFFLIFLGCKDDGIFASQGTRKQFTRQLEEFDKVEILSPIKINLTKDTSNYIVLTCGENFENKIVSNVKDGVLKIKDENKNPILHHNNCYSQIDLHYQKIQNVISFDIVEITSKDSIDIPYFAIESKGSKMDIITNAKNLRLGIWNCYGVYKIAGKSNFLSLIMQGSCTFKGEDYQVNFAEIESKTSGDISLRVKDSCKISNKWTGKINIIK